MRTRIGLVTFAALIATATIGWRAGPTPQEAGLLGAWVVTSDDESHQRGFFVFTESHYSIMHVRPGSDGRPVYASAEEPTDAEVIEAYNTFTANSGRYRLEGDQFIREAYMAKHPPYMAGWPDNDEASTVKIDGDTMTLTYSTGIEFTLRRVE